MLSLLLALTLAAAPAAEPGRLTVTFALQRPLIALEEDSWRERRADWEPAFHFARQALLLGTPTAGAAVDWQWGCFDRAAAELGRRPHRTGCARRTVRRRSR